MNEQALALWNRWISSTLQGWNPVSGMYGWWPCGLQDWAGMTGNAARFWGAKDSLRASRDMFADWQQVWASFFKLQQISLEWMEMVPKKKHDALVEKLGDLEKQVQEQARTIERLQNLLAGPSGSQKDEVVDQLQDLIDQQGRQFKQLADNVRTYIESGADETKSGP